MINFYKKNFRKIGCKILAQKTKTSKDSAPPKEKKERKKKESKESTDQSAPKPRTRKASAATTEKAESKEEGKVSKKASIKNAEAEVESGKEKGVIKQGTIAEFMRKRTQLVGFDIGLYKHTQYMAEFTDNSLDALEVTFWKFPKVYQLKEDFYFDYQKPKALLKDEDITADHLIARMNDLLEPVKDILNTEPLLIIRLQEMEKPEMLSDEQSKDTRMFLFECFDTGIGLVPTDLEKFGKYLASSKSERLKQTRGSQGFGASSAFSDAQNTTGRPVAVISRHIEQNKATLACFFTTSKNEKNYTIPPAEIDVPFQHGTYVRLNYLNVQYKRGYADDYIWQTALLNSHISLVFIDPKGDVFVFPRRVTKFPNEPKYAQPHPASSSIGDFKEMLRTTTVTSIATFLEEKFVRMSREKAKKIVENANNEFGAAKGLYSKAMSELDEKDIKILMQVIKKQKPCLSQIDPAELKQLISQSEDKPLLDYLKDAFPEISKPEYSKILKKANLGTKTTSSLTVEEIELLQNTVRNQIPCPSTISFESFNNLLKNSADQTIFDILTKDFCKLNTNTVRKIIFESDTKLNYKSLNSLLVKDLKKEEIDSLFEIFSELGKSQEINNLNDFTNFLNSGQNRSLSALLQDIKGVGKSTVAELLEKANEKLHYKTTLTLKAVDATETEIKAIYDSLMELNKCPATLTVDMMKKLLDGSTTTNLTTFLHKNFDVNTALADQIVLEANNQLGGHISLEDIPPTKLNEDQMNALYKAFISEKYLAPPTDTVVPVGADILERVIKKHFDPHYVVAETRTPTSGKGLAFAIEVAIAYGGKIEESSKASDVLYRFVNRTPKLRDNSDCAIWKTVASVNWKNYKIETFDNGIPRGKIRIFVNVNGPFVHVMFKSQSKQALADDDVLKREIQLALETVGRKIRSYLQGREVSRQKAKRALTFFKNVEKFANSIYNVECKDFNTDELIPGKPTLEVIAANLSRPIKDSLKPDIKSVLSDQWYALSQIIEDLGLESLKDTKFVKDLMSEVLDDLSKDYNIIVHASPAEIVDIFQKQNDPATEKFILETLRTQVKSYSKCETCDLIEDKTTCTSYNPENQECLIEQEIFNSLTNELKTTYHLDPINDEILLNYLGMLEVQIEKNQRLNKSMKNLINQKEQFFADLKANPTQNSIISRVKNGITLAFSDIMKSNKDTLFWRITYPDIRAILPTTEFTIEDLLEKDYPNIKGGKLTKKDDYIQEIVQYGLDNLMDQGLIMPTKKKGTYCRIEMKQQIEEQIEEQIGE